MGRRIVIVGGGAAGIGAAGAAKIIDGRERRTDNAPINTCRKGIA